MVLTPRLSPKAARLAYVSFAGGKPQVRLMDVASRHAAAAGRERRDQLRPALLARRNADRLLDDARRQQRHLRRRASTAALPQRLTTAPGIDTDPSFSPDGSKIVFESDRSGSQQLYIMNADGSNQRRISFGGGWYASPEWSPDGEWIAFTRRCSRRS